jgi:macrophage erythroblast attacher
LPSLQDSLEFALRLQEYIELCRQRSTATALTYLRKHLAPWSESHMAEIRKAMGLLACDEPTAWRVPAYAALYSRGRSGALRQRFRTTFLSLYGLPAQPTLNTALAVGLSAFKLPFCAPPPTPLPPPPARDGASDAASAGSSAAGSTVRLPFSPATTSAQPAAVYHQHERSCPTCDADLHALAQSLPASHHMTSVVVCRISGRVMDDSEEGRPMCFPNGFVYSYGVRRSSCLRLQVPLHFRLD